MILTDEEFDALDGLSAFDFKLYCLLRRRMDYATGIVGVRRRYSWQALTEWMYVEPMQGRHESGSPSKMKVRRAVQRLVDAGLLERLGPLVFRCILAAMDRSVSNMSDRRATHERQPKNDMGISANSKDKSSTCKTAEEKSDRRAAPSNPPKSDTPPVSGSNTHFVAQHGSNSPRIRVDRALIAALAKMGFRHEHIHTPKVMAMLRNWQADGVRPEDVIALVEMIRARSPGKVFTPAYLAAPMHDYLEDKHHEASGRVGQGGGHRRQAAADRASAFWAATRRFAAGSLDRGDLR